MSGLKQPLLGIVATFATVAVSFAFISLFDFTRFSGWVSTFLMCIIPMEIVMGVTWGMKQPRFAADRSQPLRGILFSLFAVAAGVVASMAHWVGGFGSVTPPTPMFTQCIIASVVVTFCWSIMWGGWPFTALIKNPFGAGLALWASCYVVNYILFRIFFNYDFLKGAPVYVPAQDPQGLYNGWACVVLYVTAVAVMFLMLCFDLWPLTKSPALMKQPLLGIVWTIVCLTISGAAIYVGVGVLKVDQVAFLVSVPIPIIFGTIFVLNMLQGSLFVKFTQPLKGVLNTVTAIVLGNAFALLYRQLSSVVSGKLDAGAPAYQLEIWLASALLAVTFPFLVAYADFFTMWPLQRATTERVMETAGGH